ncbi:tetratricopeptide repeat protein [Sphingosinicella sp. LHD-64]|uniref:tetratricopeptide repeat protein n=1 Tax=Sphingosinicella sp. LHD-64 TaxID=3072139 RepID=UPI0028102C8A|nr:tetratricopeptide repeat protein [Sphingosinicella sp. LHD-64]MDQ8755709.1 tetratricopeptide repeat protein [Sphingosinicella sp. LHD-64]
MAIKPSDGETFVREVDEELRKERINTFVTRYGWAIIAGVVLFLGAIGGWIWWQHRQAEQAGKQGETLLEALNAAESGNRNAAQPKIEELAKSDIEGYRVAALFARANAEIGANNNRAAIATLKSIADNQDFDETYRQAALVRQTALEFDSLQPQVVIQRLQPLARPGQPWFGTAGEMVGIAYMKMNQPNRAGPLFGQIAQDDTVPPSIRTRTAQMAGSLGVNALPEPAAGPAGAPSAPTAAPASAPAAPPPTTNSPATREKAE